MASRFPSLSAKLGSDRRTWKTFLCVLLLAAMAAPALGQQASAPPAPPAAPQVVVLVNLRSSDLVVTDIKFRGFYNKIERKVIPIKDYDLNAALKDEVMNAVTEDKRAQWRAATAEDGLNGAALADDKQRTPAMLASVKGDRVLVVDVYGFGGVTQSLVKNLEIGVTVLLLDHDGRKLWKKNLSQRTKFPGSFEEMQADNQKALKEAINTLIEKFGQNLKSKLTEEKI